MEGGALHYLRIRHSAAGAIAQILRHGALFASFAGPAALSGCSIAVPMSGSAMWEKESVAQDATGSITKRPPALSRALDPEDLRRAVAAMSTALDPQGSGASVNWDNPQTGAKGSFTPVGQPYPLEGKVCRAFLADIAVKENEEKLQGAACREKSAEWALTDVKPLRKG
ncbi:RT0821/Lpp0805 family surface protein [Methylocystis sp. 9N]|uniref:RT0821/Lpp0805 family surface protein n=1 Tax=Methylocystis borbori TaxID=3118750 RepID=A0ABU7XHH3_9HYPH